MTTLTVSVTRVPPRCLFLLRWLCILLGARIVVCRKKMRKEAV